MARYLRSCVADYRIMFTLTYPEGEHWRDAKRHLVELSRRLRIYEQATARGHGEVWSLFWFVEWQRRGVPHFHIFATHSVPKEWLASQWFAIVGSGDPKHLLAGTRAEYLRSGRGGTVSYARKYASKQEQKILPPMLETSGFGRWWGIKGCRDVVAATTEVTQSEACNAQVAEACENFARYVKAATAAKRARRFRIHGAVWVVCWQDRQAEEAARGFLDRIAWAIERCRSSVATARTAPSLAS